MDTRSWRRISEWQFSDGFEAARNAGFSDSEMEAIKEQWLEAREIELRRRLSRLPDDLEVRIFWDAAIEHFIPHRLPDITPCLGFYLLPLSVNGSEDERSTLVLPPSPRRAVEIAWPWAAGLADWLNHPFEGRGPKWLDMMMSEFDLTEEEASNPWYSPWAGSGARFDTGKYAKFWKELMNARKIEAARRLTAMTPWLDKRGLDGVVHCREFCVIPPTVADYHPERSVYIFPITLRSEEYCLVDNPRWAEPMPVWESFEEAKLLVARSELDVLQDWLCDIASGEGSV